MKVFVALKYFIFAFLALTFVLAQDNDQTCDEPLPAEEELELEDVPLSYDSTTQRSVVFKNSFPDEVISLFWIGPEGEEVEIVQIPPNSEESITSYNTHTFVARGLNSNTQALPRIVTIEPETNFYSFRNPYQESGNPVPKPFIQILNTKSNSHSAKFRSLIHEPIDVWYEDNRGGSYQGSLSLGKEYTVNSYEGHVFFFTSKGNKAKEYARFRINKDKILYVIQDNDHPAPQHLLDHLAKEETFRAEYTNRTGLQWIHYFGPEGPRGPPIHHMWPANEIGQIHQVASTEGYWSCLGSEDDCKSKTPLNLTLEVISTRPKAFIIKNLISEFECDTIINLAAPKMALSYVGNADAGGARKSETRTSRNTWMPRDSHPVIETLFKRAEHLLKIPRLDKVNTEDLQVVHYIDGQRYDNHHDFGVSGYPESRYLTLLLYLNDMASIDAGGETSFPKGADGKGVKVYPGKGNALLFYDMLEDGNGDDLSLHAALPVYKGEKWVSNFWVWDPKRK